MMGIAAKIKLAAGAIAALLLIGYAINYTIEQRKIGADKAISETRKMINEINEMANTADARFIACFDGGFVYDHRTNRCTEKRLNQ
jgi:hypothetical protein